MWTRRDVTWIGLTAFATMSVTLAVFWTAPATAVDPLALTPVINTPVLKTGDLELSLRVSPDAHVQVESGQAKVQPGQLPALELVATNTGSAPASVRWKASMSVSTTRDLMARVAAPAPTQAWSREDDLVVQAGKTEAMKLDTGVKLGALSTASILLAAGDTKINALVLMTAPAPKPTAAKVVASKAKADPAEAAVVAK